MSIENSPNIAGLNTAIPANTSPRAEGAAQIRGLKTAVKNTFPNVNKPVTADADRMNTIFDGKQDIKIGMIVMWPENTVPDGWAPCDGQIYNNYQTIDLQDKFVMGKSADTVVKSTGGDSEPDLALNLKVKDHILIESEIPAHKHDYVDRYYPETKDSLEKEGAADSDIMDNDGGNTVGANGTDNDNDSMLFVNAKTKATGGGKGHSHELEVNPDLPFDNRPAYVVLQYICYVGV